MAGVIVYRPESEAALEKAWTIARTIEFEGMRISYLRQSMLGLTNALQSNGIPANVMVFANSKSASPMWNQAIRFTHEGLVEDTTWQVDTELNRIVSYKMAQEFDFTPDGVALAEQYAKAFTGPDITIEQVEHGKRYMLAQLLLN